MKKALSFLLSVLFLLTVLPTAALVAPVAAEGETEPESVVLNVKDFGAVGDGKTDDEAAIWATFECALMDYMVKDIPVTVYFPEGQYGLKSGGLYVYLPRGAGNLTIKGDGADKSTIVYLEEWENGGSWVALRIYPKIQPETVDQYLHDITIQDLGVYDTDPVAHAWSKDKGDPGTEETHGYNIQYCVRATIENCKVDSVGDEALDMTHCIDSVMRDNLVINSPGAGSAGGAISVGDGCKNVLVTNNTVIGSINDSGKTNWAFAVESLTEHVEDVEISNNHMQDMAGWGVNLGAPNGTMDNIRVHHNTIYHCRDGGIRLHGKGTTTNVHIWDNSIERVYSGISVEGSNKIGTLIENGVIENVSGYAVSIGSPGNRDTVVRGLTVRNAKWRALYNAGTNTLFDRVLVDGSGTSGGVTDSAMIQYISGGDCIVSNSIFLNCQNKKGIQGATKVINTYIQQPEISGYIAFTGVSVIQNCQVNRMVTLPSGGVVDGLILTATEDLGNHAIALSGLTDCTITNCRITVPSRYGIYEAGAANRNTITNNVVVGGSGIRTIGADTVTADNRRSTLAATEQIKYYLVDGTATVLAPVRSALTELSIPNTIEGCPVTAIDPWAFALCDALQSVTIPATVTTIGTYAFYGCDSLVDVYYLGSESDRGAIAMDEETTFPATALWRYHGENHIYDYVCDAVCNECDAVRDVIHDTQSVVTAPDCVNGGYTTYTCTVCGYSYIGDETAALGHAYDAAVTAPDCVNGGYTTYTCTVCGYSYIGDETAALGHTYDAVVTAPDCANGGYTTYTCTVCGDSYVTDETAALGHTYDAAVTAPDCVNGGYTTYTCTVCGDSYVTDETAALGHTYDDYADTDCNACGFIREVPIILGDIDGNGKVNNRDLGLMQKQLNGSDLTGKVFVEAAADLDGNGKLNNRDLGLLRRLLNN